MGRPKRGTSSPEGVKLPSGKKLFDSGEGRFVGAGKDRDGNIYFDRDNTPEVPHGKKIKFNRENAAHVKTLKENKNTMLHAGGYFSLPKGQKLSSLKPPKVKHMPADKPVEAPAPTAPVSQTPAAKPIEPPRQVQRVPLGHMSAEQIRRRNNGL
jgi:hypothetical protein